ncbi:DUF6247 family protein [Actinomycetospora succinea]|uniref:DUF6247 family protein n=1 Tax=Actinomycetospora succinea TaxID=663603 RepID=UPI0010606970|nr:DUF6247 family protein [Actinomycetospora succinea]
MAATYSVDEDQGGDDSPLRPGASPRAIRTALLPADREQFDEAFASALAETRASLDLTGLFRTLEHWRGIAALHADRERFRRVARRAAQLLTGEPSPDDEPLEVTRAKAQL